jgi:hypothetical protein
MERDVLILVLRLGLAAVLYFFLFQLLVVIWRDMAPPAPPPSPEKAAAAVEILDPAGSGRMPGEQIALEAVTSVGRGPENTLMLPDASVSGRHALISYRLGQWWVEDLGSTNGTFINDVRVDQPTVISTGDIVRLGAVRLRVHV